MQQAIDQFRDNIARVRMLGGLYVTIRALVTPAIDLDDLLRTQIVLAVSALDHLVHELCRLGMAEAIQGKRPQTSATLKFTIPLAVGIDVAGGGDLMALVDGEIRRINGFKSFQAPDKISEAVRLYSDKPLWPAVALHFSESADAVKKRLALIVDRRNKIAHEADLDPSFPGQRWPIDPALATDVVDFVAKVGEAIYAETALPAQPA